MQNLLYFLCSCIRALDKPFPDAFTYQFGSWGKNICWSLQNLAFACNALLAGGMKIYWNKLSRLLGFSCVTSAFFLYQFASTNFNFKFHYCHHWFVDAVARCGGNTSGVYRFRVNDEQYKFIQTNSKLFKNPTSGLPDFVISTHAIVR